jgi:two-component system sensor histidine kinase DctS
VTALRHVASLPRAAAALLRAHPRWLWGMLMVLLGIALGLLVALTVRLEAIRAQERVDELAADAAATIRSEVLRAQQELQALRPALPPGAAWAEDALAQLRRNRETLRVERRAADGRVVEGADSPYHPPLGSRIARSELEGETLQACAAARRAAAPMVSRSYFVPLADGGGVEVVDLCLPLSSRGRDDGWLVATLSLRALLEAALPEAMLRQHELTFVEGDGARLARAGLARGSGVYVGERVIDLPGTVLQLRVDSAERAARQAPNLATVLVLGLSAALFAMVLLLARDVGRRARAEAALAEALAFRRAMEDSLSTGLRARDLQGRITYVNPAFRAMVGFSPAELNAPGTPPYWPPEHAADYLAQQEARRSAAAEAAAREGYETVFMRKNGERFPAMVYETPLVDGQGRQTGWMSAVVDISAQRRAEDLSRQQQERLQAAARLATVGEMASLLSHELNQPLAAIASYACGSLNLIDPPDGPAAAAATVDEAELAPMLREALRRIAEQAERAGRVIKSVHAFVRRREQTREAIDAATLVEAVLPLVRLQARKSGTRIEVELPAAPVRVRCDRTMVEQVLLNLARNGVQAMEAGTPPAERVLRIRVSRARPEWARFQVADAGPGIPADVGKRLFTPFFTTRAEGMGLGLSLCRTVVEQHGGALDYASPVPGRRSGTEFTFTLPVAQSAAEGGTTRRAQTTPSA